MKIVTIGSGYVGLVTSACFCEFGHDVVNVDHDLIKIDLLSKGEIPIYEPGLDHLVSQGIKSKRLEFKTKLSYETLSGASVIMIAVGTPMSSSGHADLSFVMNAAREIALNLKDYAVIVTKSTVPIGTSDKIADLIERTRPDLKKGVDFDVASNPEFLREGSAISDFMRPDRVVIGVESSRSRGILGELYRPLYLIETPILFTDIKTSELIKYASNAFLATKIAFINQMADLCECVGANVVDVAKGVGLDGRIGKKFLHVSPGYGGSCFPKDTTALLRLSQDLNVNLSIVHEVVESNTRRKEQMAERVVKALDERDINLKNAVIGLLGITFKPNTDDLRDAPSLTIISKLREKGISVRVYDPIYNAYDYSKAKEYEALNDVVWASSWEEAVKESDALMILTEWNEFRALDLPKVRLLLSKKKDRKPLFFDFRNIYSSLPMEEFDYRCLGKQIASKSDSYEENQKVA